jgi:RimJ/RimL family protein N-acetyltransferase
VQHIRPVTPQDFEMIAAWMTREDVRRWLSSEWRSDRIPPAMMLAMAHNNRRNRMYIVLDIDGSPCGIVGLSDIDTVDGHANWWGALGSTEVRGKGIMSAASKELIDYAFHELGLQALYGWFMEGNDPCRKLCERMGFKPAGVLRHTAIQDGKPVHRVFYDKTRAEHLGTA